MAKRCFDILFAAVILIATAPLSLLAAAGIVLADPGPVLYRAARAGRNGRLFRMLKFRTMRVRQPRDASVITAHRDPRIFPLGALLRALKIDELPQFLNVLAGQMSVVGPRPEDPDIVDRCYTTLQRETLTVPPGIASPGSIYHYTHAERLLEGDDAARRYEDEVLPVKLALELVYIRRATFRYDLRLIARTLGVILRRVVGARNFPPPPELAIAREEGLLDTQQHTYSLP
jgi:lipopolysaccharide/colanic/teichoic acid biosynthesis glycosyltransferase